MAKIYVGNLPFSASEADIRTLFSQHGEVQSVSLPTDRETGRPRGFGFVEMSQADAAKAIQSLNGYNMGGRPLRVNEAQDKPRTGGGRPGGGGFRGGLRAAQAGARTFGSRAAAGFGVAVGTRRVNAQRTGVRGRFDAVRRAVRGATVYPNGR